MKVAAGPGGLQLQLVCFSGFFQFHPFIPKGDTAIPVASRASAREVEQTFSLKPFKKRTKLDSQRRATIPGVNYRHDRFSGLGTKMNCHSSYFLMSVVRMHDDCSLTYK